VNIQKIDSVGNWFGGRTSAPLKKVNIAQQEGELFRLILWARQLKLGVTEFLVDGRDISPSELAEKMISVCNAKKIDPRQQLGISLEELNALKTAKNSQTKKKGGS